MTERNIQYCTAQYARGDDSYAVCYIVDRIFNFDNEKFKIVVLLELDRYYTEPVFSAACNTSHHVPDDCDECY